MTLNSNNLTILSIPHILDIIK